MDKKTKRVLGVKSKYMLKVERMEFSKDETYNQIHEKILADV